ncbi:MAG TPA: CvpA family protein [candidate division Zixibacteria bacterium]|nr:CvpA family protein [candidate division Zixibacteria bacterium]
MNWIDAVLIVVVLASVIIGSKKGLVRELMAFLVFFTAVVISVTYVDGFAVWVYDQLGGSPLISAFLSFAILLAASYAAFKLTGLLFYKIADIKDSGKRDQLGGALVGFLRGWVAIGFLTFLTFLLPMPEGYYTSFESSFFGPTVAKTIPLMFEGTSKLHPSKPSFMDQMEKTLLVSPENSNNSQDVEEHRVEVHHVLYLIDRFFNTGMNQS